MSTIRNEKGIALAMAIFALVVIGGLVSAGLFQGMQEQRVGLNTLRTQQALAAAQEGAQLEVANWDVGAYNAMAVGDSASFGGQVPNNAGWYRGKAYKFGTLLYLLRSEGFSPDSSARQHVGMLVRLRPLEISIRAGLETRGKVEIGGNAVISGRDTVPDITGCPVPSDIVAGVRIDDDDSVEYQGGNWDVAGDPAVAEDNNINDSTLTTFGDATFDDLRAMATKMLPGNTLTTAYNVYPKSSGGVCDIADPLNWGEPWEPTNPKLSASRPYAPGCETYFPIVYIDGDGYVNQQRAQGVIIVDGNLTVSGLTRFYGPVIVRGAIVAEGGGNNVPHFYGGVIAADMGGAADSTRVAGNAQIHYSSCAVQRALQGSAMGALLRERSWVNLY